MNLNLTSTVEEDIDKAINAVAEGLGSITQQITNWIYKQFLAEQIKSITYGILGIAIILIYCNRKRIWNILLNKIKTAIERHNNK